jgi:hypothetical protein
VLTNPLGFLVGGFHLRIAPEWFGRRRAGCCGRLLQSNGELVEGLVELVEEVGLPGSPLSGSSPNSTVVANILAIFPEKSRTL